jgi:hypothetical protein
MGSTMEAGEMSELVPSSSGIPEKASDDAEASAVPAVRSEPVAVEPRPSSAGYVVEPKQGELASERVIINAPMSFAGSAQRAWRLQENGEGALRWLILALVLFLLIPAWWSLILVWYFTFGLLLVPYRLLRRGARKRKKEALRHREMLTAFDEKRD